MVERSGWRQSNKEAAFHAGEQGNNSGEEKQKSKPFAPDLAQRIYEQFMGALPDSTSLSGFYKYRKHVGEVPHGAWLDFLQGLEFRERIEASAVIQTLRRAGYPDVGSVRKADIEEVYEKNGVGPKRAAFIKEVFKARENGSETQDALPATHTRHTPRQGALYDLPFIHNPLKKSSR